MILHILVCLFLIFIVLIQSGKGAELGAAFGGASQTLFGARGAATFLSKLTTASAIIFMITSMLLAVMATKGGSVVKKTVSQPAGQKTMPPMPGQQPPAGQPAQSQPMQQPTPQGAAK